MKILAFSDLHLGKGLRDIVKIQRQVEKLSNDCDLVCFCGDLAEEHVPVEHVEAFYRWFGSINKPIAMVAGNNDYDWLKEHGHEIKAITKNQYMLFAEKCASRSFATKVNDTEIITNTGFYDCSLWTNGENTPDAIPLDQDSTVDEYPDQKEDVVKLVTDWFNKNNDLHGYDTFMIECQNEWHQIKKDIRVSDKSILLTHYIPCRGFTSGKTAKFRYLNAFMGSDQTNVIASLWDWGLQAVLCGHTHRYGKIMCSNVPVYNVSGPDQPYAIEVP